MFNSSIYEDIKQICCIQTDMKLAVQMFEKLVTAQLNIRHKENSSQTNAANLVSKKKMCSLRSILFQIKLIAKIKRVRTFMLLDIKQYF